MAAATGRVGDQPAPWRGARRRRCLCIVVLALASRVSFDTPFGFTVATQLAFVPLLFALPPALVPPAVMLALVLANVPDVVSGKIRAAKLLAAPANSWFAIGPALVFALAHVAPWTAGGGLLVVALAAQFAGDFAASALYFGVTRQAGLRAQLGECWVYGIDAGLSGVGLVVAEQVRDTPAAVLAVVPLLGLLAMFAHERNRRLGGLLELNETYRGTALLLGDVIAADDGYTGEHSQMRGRAGADAWPSASGSTPSGGATSSSRRCCTTSARSRFPRRSSTSRASSMPRSGGS